MGIAEFEDMVQQALPRDEEHNNSHERQTGASYVALPDNKADGSCLPLRTRAARSQKLQMNNSYEPNP
jgi:hypothetical protein